MNDAGLMRGFECLGGRVPGVRAMKKAGASYREVLKMKWFHRVLNDCAHSRRYGPATDVGAQAR